MTEYGERGEKYTIVPGLHYSRGDKPIKDKNGVNRKVTWAVTNGIDDDGFFAIPIWTDPEGRMTTNYSGSTKSPPYNREIRSVLGTFTREQLEEIIRNSSSILLGQEEQIIEILRRDFGKD